MITDVISGLALLVAAYGVWLSRHVARREEHRDEQRRTSDIKVFCGERSGLAGPAVIGTSVPIEHVLMIRSSTGARRLSMSTPLPLRANVRFRRRSLSASHRALSRFDYGIGEHELVGLATLVGHGRGSRVLAGLWLYTTRRPFTSVARHPVKVLAAAL
jgi:hypothetical protein